MGDKRGNCAIQLMVLWNTVNREMYDSYRETIRLMLKKSKELYGKQIINKVFDNGQTLLHTAVMKADEATVEILIDLGADVKRQNAKGDTVLALAKEQERKWPSKFEVIWPTLE